MTSNDETPAMRRERRKRGSFQAPVYLSAHSNTNSIDSLIQRLRLTP